MNQKSIDNLIAKTRAELRVKHYAWKTEKAYVGWINRFCIWLYSNKNGTHEQKLHGYLSHLANNQHRQPIRANSLLTKC